MQFKKILSIKSSFILTILPIISVTACNSNYDEIILKIKNKETFIGYIGSENCPGCQTLSKQWDLWMQEKDWDKDILDLKDENLKINRYAFVSDYDFKGANDNTWNKTFFETKWVKNTFEWLKKSQKNLWATNENIKNGFDPDYLPGNGIPTIFFVKNGEYRWFINKWGDAVDGIDDMLTSNSEFKQKPAYNRSTLTRLVRDFIINDFKDFYTLN